jgi:ubiquinone/menaquinone biosynthesis C-methylase UbiE
MNDNAAPPEFQPNRGNQSCAYWIERGGKYYTYRGEVLYTITPAPLYVARRALLVGLILEVISREKPATILDFGCGDGWYIDHLMKKVSGARFYGVDSSDTMLSAAHKKSPKALLYKSLDKVPAEASSLDMVYAISVLAHMSDDDINETSAQVLQTLRHSGSWVMFEQIAPFNYANGQFVRRTIPEYVALATQAGFSKTSIHVVDFLAHRWFERHIAKIYYRFLCRARTDHDRRLAANRQPLFHLLSKLFLMLSSNPLQQPAANSWGYAFFHFKKL